MIIPSSSRSRAKRGAGFYANLAFSAQASDNESRVFGEISVFQYFYTMARTIKINQLNGEQSNALLDVVADYAEA